MKIVALYTEGHGDFVVGHAIDGTSRVVYEIYQGEDYYEVTYENHKWLSHINKSCVFRVDLTER